MYGSIEQAIDVTTIDACWMELFPAEKIGKQYELF